MLSTFFQPCEAKVHLLQNVIFVHPPEPVHPDLPAPHDAPPSSEDELIRGLVELRVPSDRSIGGIRVRLLGSEMIAIVDPTTSTPIDWDERIILDKTLQIGVSPARSRTQSRSRNPSRASSRAPSQPVSRAGSPTRRGSTPQPQQDHHDSEPVERGRTTSLGTSRSRRDPSTGTGLTGAFAAAYSRSRSRALPHASRGNASSRSTSSFPAASPTVSARQSMSRLPVYDEIVESPRGRSTRVESQYTASVSASRSYGVSIFPRGASRARTSGDVRRSTPIPGEEGTSRCADASDGEGMFLAKGIHGFEFAFILPSDCAPYERSAYGRVRYMIKATILGGGRAKSNIDQTREVFPMAVPSHDSPATPLNVLYHDWHHSLGGVLSVACTANSISVGGIFNIDVHSPDSPEDSIVYQVRASLETQIDLYTSKKGKQTAHLRPARLFERGVWPQRPADMESPKIRDACVHWCGSQSSWSVQGLARIPDDNTTRPTTLPGSKADIRFSHQLLVEVVHSRAPEKDGYPPDSHRRLKVYALRQPVVIPSCCVAYQAVTLPLYEEKDPTTKINNTYRVPDALTGKGSLPTQSPWSVAAAPLAPAGHEYCVCGMSIADLEAKERHMLPRFPDYNVPVDEVRSRGKIGDYLAVDDVRSTNCAGARSSGSASPAPWPASTSPSSASTSTSTSISTSASTSTSASAASGSSPPSSSPLHDTAASVSPRASGRPSHERPTVPGTSSSPARQPANWSPPQSRSVASSPAQSPHLPAEARRDGMVARSGSTRDNLSVENPRTALPLAPSPGESGQATPSTRPPAPLQARHSALDLSEAISRLHALSMPGQEASQAPHLPPRELPPAYES